MSRGLQPENARKVGEVSSSEVVSMAELISDDMNFVSCVVCFSTCDKGGGHQDQVGGLLGGVKICRTAASLPLQVLKTTPFLRTNPRSLQTGCNYPSKNSLAARWAQTPCSHKGGSLENQTQTRKMPYALSI